MVVRGGAMGMGSGGLGGWLCTRRGEKKNPDFGPPGGRARPQIEHSLPPQPPKCIISIVFALSKSNSFPCPRHPGPASSQL